MYQVSQLQDYYRRKLIAADQTAAMVKDGDRVLYDLTPKAPAAIEYE